MKNYDIFILKRNNKYKSKKEPGQNGSYFKVGMRITLHIKDSDYSYIIN